MLNKWIDAMEQAIRELKEWPEKTIQIFHHNDADGITSGSILTRAFERQGYQVRRFCLEKPYPAVLKKVFEQEGRIIAFADFAGRIAPMISDLNKGRNLVLILDHHVAAASTDPKVHNLDPDLFGLKGDRDISGSTTCYHFAITLDWLPPVNASDALVGRVKDDAADEFGLRAGTPVVAGAGDQAARLSGSVPWTRVSWLSRSARPA